MAEHQHSTRPDAGQHRGETTPQLPWPQPAGLSSGRPLLRGRTAAWGDGLEMIAVTSERLCTASSPAEASGYLPTVPADSEERILD